MYTCVKQGKRWSYLRVIEVGIRDENTCKNTVFFPIKNEKWHENMVEKLSQL